MSGQRRAALWCAVAAVLGLALWLAWPILSPFLIAVGVASVLDPLVGRIEGLGASRTGATAAVTIGFGLMVMGMLAAPAAAAIAVLLRYAVARYVESPLYLGRSVG